MTPSAGGKKERTTILVCPDLYKRFRAYALEHDTTVSALIEGAMREIVEK